jgi:hypothetical protein
MKLPKNILDIFEKESEDLSFGKVSVSIIAGGEHYHYEIDKHITVGFDENSQKNHSKGEKNE